MTSEEASADWAKLLTVHRLHKETLEGEASFSEAVCSFNAQLAPGQALVGPGEERGLQEKNGPRHCKG